MNLKSSIRISSVQKYWRKNNPWGHECKVDNNHNYTFDLISTSVIPWYCDMKVPINVYCWYFNYSAFSWLLWGRLKIILSYYQWPLSICIDNSSPRFRPSYSECIPSLLSEQVVAISLAIEQMLSTSWVGPIWADKARVGEERVLHMLNVEQPDSNLKGLVWFSWIVVHPQEIILTHR